jgi:uncharacterized protein (TIGR00266 family)
VEARVLYETGRTALRVILSERESMLAEPSAIASLTLNAELKPVPAAGEREAHAKHRGPGGFRLVQIVARSTPTEVLLCPPLPGDLLPIHVAGDGVHVVSTAFVAAEARVSVKAEWAGVRGMFAWETPVLLTCDGVGELFVASYGAFHVLELLDGQGYRAQTGYVVAVDRSVHCELAPAAEQTEQSPLAEGKWCDLVGPGRLYMQTRSVDALLGRLAPRLLGAP